MVQVKKYLTVFTAAVLLFPLMHKVSAANQLAMPSSVEQFAFGSCAKERKPQPIWNSIAATEPQLFLFIGDNVYADLWKADGQTLRSAPVTTPERFATAYATLAAIPEFAAFRQKVPILATWDDHDYGANDAGKHYPLKDESQQHFLDFFGFPQDDPLRQQAGIYYSRTLGEPGRRVQFIMLDTRYHRDDLVKKSHPIAMGDGPYTANLDPNASMLGEEQWQWLKEILTEPAELRFIISSIQVVAHEHGFESWGTLPLERQRLYDLIASTEAKGVILLSGDRHLTEVSVDRGELGSTVPYPIWDLTASGMTDDIQAVDEENRFRQGPVYRGSHFATMNIEWGDVVEDTQVIFRAIAETGELINEQRIDLKDLQSQASLNNYTQYSH